MNTINDNRNCTLYKGTTFNTRNLASFIESYFNINQTPLFHVRFSPIERKMLKKVVGPITEQEKDIVPYHIVCDFATFQDMPTQITPERLIAFGKRIIRKKNSFVLMGENTNIFDPKKKRLKSQFRKDYGLHQALLGLSREKALHPEIPEKELMDSYISILIKQNISREEAKYVYIKK